MHSNQWIKRWDNDAIGFHKSETHPDLIIHEKILLGDAKCRVFLPLCGKSVDLVYLADRGYDVHGCEFVEKAVKDFFDENSLEYALHEDSKTGTVVYTAVNKKITFYQGDFFALTTEVVGKFDAIWDRGSFVAIDPSQRIEYAKVMLDLMAATSKYLLNTFIITGENYKGPPYHVSEEEINMVFQKYCDIKLLDSKVIDVKYPNVDRFEIQNRLLSLKRH